MTLKKEPSENIVGKQENAGNQYFLLSPTMFFILARTNIAIWITFNLLSANALNLDLSEILLFGNRLSHI